MLITRAGYGLAGAPSTGTPPAQSIAAMMSESVPPHLPSARTGSTQPFHVVPAIPRALFETAPTMPATRVPCHELSSGALPLNGPDAASAADTQSPGSDGSASQPSPSLAFDGSRTKS